MLYLLYILLYTISKYIVEVRYILHAALHGRIL